ncbi:hypothetical protein WA026_016199 [Henosepilachna vigintioctopunctata]|uniref:Transposase n=1 Tax=Henosepilachna vigintioctopunctata TaxID=420089 RepID=A0AAW1TU64_9CUCU
MYLCNTIDVQYSTKLIEGEAPTVQTSVNGFQKTGLWPVDSNVFPDYLFEPAETTNILMQKDRMEPEEDSTAAKNLADIEETKTKTTSATIPKKNTKKVTKALDLSSYIENDLSFFLKTGDDDEDCPCICCNDLYSRSKPKEVWLKCLSCKRWAHAS